MNQDNHVRLMERMNQNEVKHPQTQAMGLGVLLMYEQARKLNGLVDKLLSRLPLGLGPVANEYGGNRALAENLHQVRRIKIQNGNRTFDWLSFHLCQRPIAQIDQRSAKGLATGRVTGRTIRPQGIDRRHIHTVNG